MELRQGEPIIGAPAVVLSRPGGGVETVQYFRCLTLFAESADSLHAARGLVQSTLTDWNLPKLVDDVQLAVSELVGNVVHHAIPDERRSWPGARRRIDVALRKWPQWLFLGVADEDSSPPTYPAIESFSPDLVDGMSEALLPEHGRGLVIIHRLADALWWVPEEGGGKTVFCRFDLDADARVGPH